MMLVVIIVDCVKAKRSVLIIVVVALVVVALVVVALVVVALVVVALVARTNSIYVFFQTGHSLHYFRTNGLVLFFLFFQQ